MYKKINILEKGCMGTNSKNGTCDLLIVRQVFLLSRIIKGVSNSVMVV